MIKKICFLIIILQLLILPLYARDQNALTKLGRGATNLSLGWAEIIRQTIKVNEPDYFYNQGERRSWLFFNPVTKLLLWGPLKGLAYAIERSFLGVFEVTTFLFPPYEPFIDPEFVFSEEVE